MAVELWTTGVSFPGVTTRHAVRAESEGWTGLAIVDSQNLAADPYVCLALAARETSSLMLGTAVTNPVTRHPAVTATAISTVDVASGGRAVLGIGRGDSALAHLGLAPAPVPLFGRYLERLQGYLSGSEVPFDVDNDGASGIPPVSSLGLAGGPTTSRIHWLIPEQRKVPVDVAATGPRVIDTAAQWCERVSFAVGADPSRLAWAADLARAGGRNPSLGAYVTVGVGDDLDAVRSLVSGAVASFARFSSMHGRATGPDSASESDRRVLEGVHDRYDMAQHFRHGSPQSSVLTSDFVDRFAIVGPPAVCVARMEELVKLGIERFIVNFGGIGADAAGVRASHTLFVEEVMPAVLSF